MPVLSKFADQTPSFWPADNPASSNLLETNTYPDRQAHGKVKNNQPSVPIYASGIVAAISVIHSGL
jgi:hypothetical protein